MNFDENLVLLDEKQKERRKPFGKYKEEYKGKYKLNSKGSVKIFFVPNFRNFGETFAITFGDRAGNCVGMQKLGKSTDTGFTLDDLLFTKKEFKKIGIKSVLYDLTRPYLPLVLRKHTEDAFLLVIRGGLSILCEGSADEFYDEQKILEKDKVWMKGRVVNKMARYDLCFAEFSRLSPSGRCSPSGQDPDYENKKGKIPSFDDESVPLLKNTRKNLSNFLGEKAENLFAESSYYYDLEKCGISFHGDFERRKVVGIRVGDQLPLHFQWFCKTKPIGERAIINLYHGDIYIMSEKATGNDWKKRNIPTLRHATGCKNLRKSKSIKL